MPKLNVLACPSCGASLPVEDDPTIKCQFCGNTVIVPEELRSKSDTPATPTPVVLPAGVAPGSVPALQHAARLKEMGDAIRAGNQIAAIKIYREIFGSSLQDAKTAVELLAAGQSIQVPNLGGGLPTTLQVSRVAPPAVTVTPTMTPVMTSGPVVVTAHPAAARLGCLFSVVLTLVILGATLVPLFMAGAFTLPFLPFIPGISEALGQLTGQFATVEMSFGGTGTGAGTFTDARAITVDDDGKIYVGEFDTGRVQVFDAAGEFLTQWQLQTESENDIYLESLVAGPDGVVYATHNSEIFMYDGETGEPLGALAFDEGWGFSDIYPTADGGLVAAWYKNRDDIVVFDADGEMVTHITEAISGVSGDSELDTQVAADGLGNIYALGTFNNGIFHYDADGRYLNRFGSDGDEPGQLRAPIDIAVDNQSRIYVSDFKGIQVFGQDGRYIDVIRLPGSAYVYSLTFDEDGALYAVANDNKVYKLKINEPAE